jgi:rubrerythrin
MSLRRERRRIEKVFGALLVALTPAAAFEACGTSDSAKSGPFADAQTADTTVPDGTHFGADATDENANDAAPDVVSTGFDANCQTNVVVNDSGIDADVYAPPTCTYELTCGIEPPTLVIGCGVYLASANDAAPTPLDCWVREEAGCENDVFVPDAPVTIVECADCLAGGGRRPAGLRAALRGQKERRIGRYFASMAFEEAAAVLAFERMHEELEVHGAPRELLREAKRAAKDEVRHARVMTRLARAADAKIQAPRIARKAPRALEAIARENATEGCVRETFGALLLAWQARHASDPDVRRTFERVATDEARHAALSWAVARWIEPRLTARARSRIASAQKRALRDLRRAAAARATTSFDAAIGHPSAPHAEAMLVALERSLFA